MKLAIRIFVGLALALFLLSLPAFQFIGRELGVPVLPAAVAVVFFPAMVWLWRLSARPPSTRPKFTFAALIVVGLLGVAAGVFVTMLYVEVGIGMAKGDRLRRIEAPAR
jgi:hypothetical protein